MSRVCFQSFAFNLNLFSLLSSFPKLENSFKDSIFYNRLLISILP